jgi:hypothetical protein
MQLLSGCGGVPVATHPVEKFVDKEKAESLIGSTKAQVIEHFGQADLELQGEEKSYFLYAARGTIDAMWDVFIPFIILPPSVYGEHGHEPIYCALFEFDRDQTLRRFKTKSGTVYAPYSKYEVCLHHYFTKQQLETFFAQELAHSDRKLVEERFHEQAVESFMGRKELRRQLSAGDESYAIKEELAVLGDYAALADLAERGDVRAARDLYRIKGDKSPLEKLADEGSQEARDLIETLAETDLRADLLVRAAAQKRGLLGDADAQFQLYYSMKTRERLLWLCRAADSGHAFARFRMALVYEKGLDDVPFDSALAQMWYRLAARSGHAWGDANADRLAATSSASVLEEVQRLLQDWAPGQCAAQLGLSQEN